MNNETIRMLLKCNSKESREILLNNKYCCKFIMPNDLQDNTYYFFSEFINDKNCLRSTCYSDVNVYYNNDMKYGRVFIHYDKDIQLYSMSLALYDNGKIFSIITVIDCKI